MFRFTPEMASRIRFIKPTIAARVYGVHLNTIYSKVKHNSIAYIKIDGAVRIAVWADDYQQWLDEQKEENESQGNNAETEKNDDNDGTDENEV